MDNSRLPLYFTCNRVPLRELNSDSTTDPREKLDTDYALALQQEDDELERNMALMDISRICEDSDDVAPICPPPGFGYKNEKNSDSSSSQLNLKYYSLKGAPTDFQINKYRQLVIESVARNPVNIIKGPTGCGKTTQVPQFILDDCRNKSIPCRIIVTQSRRMAAISIAQRVSEERNCVLGSVVGYHVGYDKNMSEDTLLLYCTSGVLLKQLIASKDLSFYSHIIVDEINERDCEIDFLLLLIKRLMINKGQQTKIILMSASMNTDKLSKYYSGNNYSVRNTIPVIDLVCHTRFPVSIFHLDSVLDFFQMELPVGTFDKPNICPDMYELVARLIAEFFLIDVRENNEKGQYLGSVLIFLPGIHEIEIMSGVLKGKNLKEWEIHSLHSHMKFDEQSKVFKPSQKGCRKIIISTNIAASSISIPDIKYVIDFCLTKIRAQESNVQYSSLQLSWTSKCQARQREGRVGIFMPGRVYRLIPANLYKKLPEELTPELLRCPLETLVIKSKQLNMGSPTSILGRALDPPNLSNIHRTILDLKMIGALLVTSNGSYKDDDGDITLIGHIMASLPLDAHLSKLIILGHMFGCLSESIIMACAMSLRSSFYCPIPNRLEAYSSRLAWSDGASSDPIAFLNLYLHWKRSKKPQSESSSAKIPKYYVLLKLLHEVSDLEIDMKNRLRNFNIYIGKEEADVDVNKLMTKETLLKVILAGAAYPNYFLQKPVNDKDAIKMLGGRNPFNTVYFANLPPKQPGPLYIHSIKEYFEQCGSGVQVSFDTSNKAYVTFESSITRYDKYAKVYENGQTMTSVYKAIKMRKSRVYLNLPILPLKEALRKSKAIFGIGFNNPLPNYKNFQKEQAMLLPGAEVSTLQVFITHIASPYSFWVNLTNPEAVSKSEWLFCNMQKPAFLTPLTPNELKKGVEGQICGAPYPVNGVIRYFRAKILCVFEPEQKAKVFYIDFGNSADVEFSKLRLISEEGHKIGLSTEPGRAIHCSLAQIVPSLQMNPNGIWSKYSTLEFLKHFEETEGIAWVYSVTNGIVNVYLYQNSGVFRKPINNIPPKTCFNYYLISKGFANQSEESYLSQENHKFRCLSALEEHTSHAYPFVFQNVDTYAGFKFESPSYAECQDKVKLNGPFSPLESPIHALTQHGQGSNVVVDWNSVNSVLLDTTLTGNHRLVVASSVSQKDDSNEIILRNTTLMPAKPGIYSIIPMVFAPRVELRANERKNSYIGALYGLGYDEETGEGYYQEKDMEIAFDTQLDQNDIDEINKIRHWLNYLIEVRLDQNYSGFKEGRKKLQESTMKLLARTRKQQNIHMYSGNFQWRSLNSLDMVKPQKYSTSESIFVLISSYVSKDITFADPQLMEEHLEKLRLYAEGVFHLRGGVTCLLCQNHVKDVHALRTHIESLVHRRKVADFLNS